MLLSLKKLREDKLRNIIEEFKDELKDFKNILDKINEPELLKEQEIDETKNKTKRELSMLDDEISDILEKLDVNVKSLKLRCRFYEKPHDFEKGRELRLSAKEKIDEIKRLKEEVENNKDNFIDHLLDAENNFCKLLTDLEYEKHNALHDFAILGLKLIKLEITSRQINKIKELVLLS